MRTAPVLSRVTLSSRWRGTARPRGSPSAVGIFEDHGDVGDVLHPGSANISTDGRSYTVSGSGENMWFARDAFHFVWKRASGDVGLAADVAFRGAGTNPHRKACLMIRQSLAADSAYVDLALHGDGLTSLQFRDSKGAATHEIQANVTAPGRLRIEKRGKYTLDVRLARQMSRFLLGSGRAGLPWKSHFM